MIKKTFEEKIEGKDYVMTFTIEEKLPVVVEPEPVKVLPRIYINTNDVPIATKETYIPGGMSTFIEGVLSESIKIEIKKRGNSTLNKPKPSFKCKTDKKISLFGFPASKKYALYADFLDHSCLRNPVMYKISEILQMPWTPKYVFVEVFVNAVYMGLYKFAESVEVEENRVNIKLLDKKTPLETHDGFLLNISQWQDELHNWISNDETKIPYSLKEPEDVSPEQLAEIKNKLQILEDKIRTYQNVSDLIDVDSWCKWAITNDYMKNRDSILFDSCYMYYDPATKKFYFGPVHDADLSSGNAGTDGLATRNSPIGLYLHDATLLGTLYKFHYREGTTMYIQRFREIWKENREALSTIPQFITRTAIMVEAAAIKNAELWPTTHSEFEGMSALPNWHEEVNFLYRWFVERFNFLDAEWNK